MKTEAELKQIVKSKYAEIALQSKETNQSSCCGAGGCSSVDYTIMSDDYTQLEGYTPMRTWAWVAAYPRSLRASKPETR